MQTEDVLNDFEGDVLILSGDTPMLSYETAEVLINNHIEKSNLATLLTANVENPYGYGRIIRDENGKFLKIVEEKDADDEQKKIAEINAAIYIVNSKLLFDALKKITPDNKQNEYYLTDIFHFIPKDSTGTVVVDNEIEILGINSLEQLQEMEELIRSNN
jgi:bifunctional N-acetylglucosamine-1-phosphate-uridyltransferase/glucosamine-1-phosphate-acetyltransferase GlmU-like protein